MIGCPICGDKNLQRCKHDLLNHPRLLKGNKGRPRSKKWSSVDWKKSTKQIAQELNCTQGTVSGQRKLYQ